MRTRSKKTRGLTPMVLEVVVFAVKRVVQRWSAGIR